MLPRVRPIAPIRRKEPFDDPDWLFDLKYDGFRSLCYLEQGRCRFTPRNGNTMSRCDAIGDQMVAAIDVNDAILDGEVIAGDASGRPQFYDLLRHTRATAYVALDILWLNGATFGLCRSASTGGGCKQFCRRHRRQSPDHWPSRAKAASSSNS